MLNAEMNIAWESVQGTLVTQSTLRDMNIESGQLNRNAHHGGTVFCRASGLFLRFQWKSGIPSEIVRDKSSAKVAVHARKLMYRSWHPSQPGVVPTPPSNTHVQYLLMS